MLTYFRIIAGPIIFFLILPFQSYGLALLILLLASASDYWDGYLARKYSLTSVLGAVLDPIADKILITFVLMALVLALDSIFIAFLGSIMLAREFWVGALRDINARNQNEAATTVTFLAKIKTTMQLVTFCWILTGPVSYTHLRAHETDSYLVCRLLLEKNLDFFNDTATTEIYT